MLIAISNAVQIIFNMLSLVIAVKSLLDFSAVCSGDRNAHIIWKRTLRPRQHPYMGDVDDIAAMAEDKEVFWKAALYIRQFGVDAERLNAKRCVEKQTA